MSTVVDPMHATSYSTADVTLDPEYSEWPILARENSEVARGWHFDVAGVSAADMRHATRTALLSIAEGFSSRLGVGVRPVKGLEGLIVMSGHQPELIHPGVWVKMFLLQKLADESGATPINLVVDSDGFDQVAASSPCMAPEARTCEVRLMPGGTDVTFASAPSPGLADVERFSGEVLACLRDLGSDVPALMFGRFADVLRSAAADARNLAEAQTFARRRYEEPAGSDYLEALVTELAQTEPFIRFAMHIAFAAERFATDYNAELAAYRAATGTRSAAQPVPDLKVRGDDVELPFWHLGQSGRDHVWARRSDGAVELRAGGEVVAIPTNDPDTAVATLRASGLNLVPKALTLTMFTRMFACDLMIHGTGGGRYDKVTDGIIPRFFGVKPPRSVIATATVRLPLVYEDVTEDDVSAATERLNRLAHNPDAALSEASFDTRADYERALELAREKSDLVAEIALPGADKKAVGTRIRTVNAQLAELVRPLRMKLESDLARAHESNRVAAILGDRTYPFCYFDPVEVRRLVG